MGFIYKITNTITHKIYIGQTTRNLCERWSEHVHESIYPHKGVNKTYLHKSIAKYGPDAFIIEQIEEVPDDLLDTQEMFWISEYKSNHRDYGYNLTSGGSTGSHFGSHSKSVSKGLPVVQYDLFGKPLKVFQSAKDADRIVKSANRNTIMKSCKERSGISGGYQWRFFGDDPPGQYNGAFHAKTPVVQYDECGTILKIFPSAKEAYYETGIYFGSISKCCKGHYETAGGFRWSYFYELGVDYGLGQNCS